MDQQPQGKSDKRDKKIADMEARLNDANQMIEDLKQENSDLRKYVEHLAKNRSQQYPKPNQVQTKLSGYRKIIRKSRFSQLSDWQFHGIVFLVAILIPVLFGVITSFNNRANNSKLKTVQNSTKPTPNSVSNLPTLPTNGIIEVNPIHQTTLEEPITQGNNFPSQNSQQLSYRIIQPYQLQKSEELKSIVDQVTHLAKKRNLPLKELSITLIDINNSNIAGYRQSTLRYPASVVKLFWMVILEAKIKQQGIQLEAGIKQQGIQKTDFQDDLNKMILNSDNNAASRIVDLITDTKSSPNKLEGDEYVQWEHNRTSLNSFFTTANYNKDINISQKTFPIPDLKMSEPQGTDLQIRGTVPKKPIRNRITTDDAARLMYEIATSRAVAEDASKTMLDLLTRDLRPEAWTSANPDEFNPVKSFLGEGLKDEDVTFASKAGWTNFSREEVAYVATRDQSTKYILAILGDDPAYGKNKLIFPEISKLVFDQMTCSRKRSPHTCFKKI
jgi:hypothetical protein